MNQDDIRYQSAQPAKRNLVFSHALELHQWINENRENIVRGQILFVRDTEKSYWWDGADAKELSNNSASTAIYPVYQYLLDAGVENIKCDDENEGIWIDKTGAFRYLLINGKIKQGIVAETTETIVTLGDEFTPAEHPMRGNIIAINGVVKTATGNKPITGSIRIDEGVMSLTFPACAVNDRVWATALWIGA